MMSVFLLPECGNVGLVPNYLGGLFVGAVLLSVILLLTVNRN